MPELLYHVEDGDARASSVLAFVFESIGVDAEPGPPPEAPALPQVVYGVDAEPAPGRVVLQRSPADRLWNELFEGSVDARSLGGRVPFDVVAAIDAFLSDDIHRGLDRDALDEHGRLRFAASATARAGLGDVPVVNAYVALVRDVLSETLDLHGRARWPEGRRAAIGLSHDVDLPDRYDILRSALRPWRFRHMPRTYLRVSASLAARRLRDRHPDDHWLFDRIMESEASLGLTSTFFFAPVPFHARWGVGWDVGYDVRRAPFRAVFRAMRDAGFEVGLHASYRAFEDPARLRAEKALLGDAAGVEVRGLRHHYWQLGPDPAATLRAQEAAGFDYDTSLAFNDHVGFRRGVALPFRVFDAELGRTLRTTELPTVCMDGNLFYGSQDVDAAVAAVNGLVDRIVLAEGLGVIDWHVQTSYPGNDDFRAWGVAYQEIIRCLAARRDVWVTGTGAILDWVAGRRGAARTTPRPEPPATA